MSHEVFALATLLAGIMVAVILIAMERPRSCRPLLWAIVIGTVFWSAFVVSMAFGDTPLKGYLCTDAKGYLIVSDKDIADAKKFGTDTAKDAAKHAKESGEHLVPGHVATFFKTEGLRRYPSNRAAATPSKRTMNNGMNEQ